MQEKYIGMCFCVYDGESFDDHVSYYNIYIYIYIYIYYNNLRGQICQIPVKWTMAILLKATVLPVSDINYDYIFREKKARLNEKEGV